MDVDAIRALYEYHFALNRRVWNECIMALSEKKFIQELPYSVGSIRNQVVHMMSVDQRWFARLQEIEVPEPLDPRKYSDRVKIRTRWNIIEADMRLCLHKLQAEHLYRMVDYPSWPEASGIPAWQILMHVVNHATDHRAQILAMLCKLGAPTLQQDYIVYLWSMEDTDE